MRVPGRLHIMWTDDNTLKIDTDAGTGNRFVVVETSLTGVVRGVSLGESYRYYALSNDGRGLYLLENAGGQPGRNRWRVWVYDLQQNRWDPKPLADELGRYGAPGAVLELSGRTDLRWKGWSRREPCQKSHRHRRPAPTRQPTPLLTELNPSWQLSHRWR